LVPTETDQAVADYEKAFLDRLTSRQQDRRAQGDPTAVAVFGGFVL